MNWWFTVPCWIVAAYFGIGFVIKAGFPPKTETLLGDALFVGITLFFLFAPFFNKIKIKLGSWVELEREVKEAKKEAAAAKEELREFKNEVRNTVSVISTSAMHQNINLHLPDPTALQKQQDQVKQQLGAEVQKQADAVEDELQEDGDVSLALAKVRIDIERLLRTIVGRTLKVPDPSRARSYQSIQKMFDQVVEKDQNLAFLAKPLTYVIRVCNAAMHAQYVTREQAAEAIQLGAQIIAALKQHPDAAQYRL